MRYEERRRIDELIDEIHRLTPWEREFVEHMDRIRSREATNRQFLKLADIHDFYLRDHPNLSRAESSEH